MKACVERNWEFIGHGYTQRNMQKVENERADIRKSTEVIEKATGKRPRGWLGPGLTETWETPDILAEEGYDYVADWVLDDQPVWLKTRGKPILNIPYTQECNDVAMMLIQHHKASEYYERAMDQFEQIYEDAKGSRAGDGDCGAPLHHGRAAPGEIFPQDLREDPQEEGRAVLDRRADRGLVRQGRARRRRNHMSVITGLTRPSPLGFSRLKPWTVRYRRRHDDGERLHMAPGAEFLDKKTIAELTAKMYLDVGAVRFMEDKPFIFTSGWASPVYNDSRWLISFPERAHDDDGFRRRHHRPRHRPRQNRRGGGRRDRRHPVRRLGGGPAEPADAICAQESRRASAAARRSKAS